MFHLPDFSKASVAFYAFKEKKFKHLPFLVSSEVFNFISM